MPRRGASARVRPRRGDSRRRGRRRRTQATPIPSSGPPSCYAASSCMYRRSLPQATPTPNPLSGGVAPVLRRHGSIRHAMQLPHSCNAAPSVRRSCSLPQSQAAPIPPSCDAMRRRSLHRVTPLPLSADAAPPSSDATPSLTRVTRPPALVESLRERRRMGIALDATPKLCGRTARLRFSESFRARSPRPRPRGWLHEPLAGQ